MKGKQNENVAFDLLSDGKKQMKKEFLDENNQVFCTVKCLFQKIFDINQKSNFIQQNKTILKSKKYIILKCE